MDNGKQQVPVVAVASRAEFHHVWMHTSCGPPSLDETRGQQHMATECPTHGVPTCS